MKYNASQLVRAAMAFVTQAVAPRVSQRIVGGTFSSAFEPPEDAAVKPSRRDDNAQRPAQVVVPAIGGPTIVVTAMHLSKGARGELARRLGAGFIVFTLRDAAPTADMVLVPPGSPQLIDFMRARYPDATLLVAELEDEESGIDFGGPISRSLRAGADGYFVAPSLPRLAASVSEVALQQRTQRGIELESRMRQASMQAAPAVHRGIHSASPHGSIKQARGDELAHVIWIAGSSPTLNARIASDVASIRTGAMGFDPARILDMLAGNVGGGSERERWDQTALNLLPDVLVSISLNNCDAVLVSSDALQISSWESLGAAIQARFGIFDLVVVVPERANEGNGAVGSFEGGPMEVLDESPWTARQALDAERHAKAVFDLGTRSYNSVVDSLARMTAVPE